MKRESSRSDDPTILAKKCLKGIASTFVFLENAGNPRIVLFVSCFTFIDLPSLTQGTSLRKKKEHLFEFRNTLNASQEEPLSSNLARAGSPVEHTPPWFALFFMFFQTIQRASCLLTRSSSLIIFPWRTSKQLFRLSYHVTNCMQVYSSISRSVLAKGCLVWIVGKPSLEFSVWKLGCEFCLGGLPKKKNLWLHELQAWSTAPERFCNREVRL